MADKLTYRLRIVKAVNLPKTDTFGKTDAYIKVWARGAEVARTTVIKSNLHPVWDCVFNIEASPKEVIRLELKDQDLGGSETVGEVELYMSQMQPGSFLEVSPKFVNDKLAKAGTDAKISLFLEGWMKTYSCVKAEMAQFAVPGVVCVDSKRHIYLPAPALAPGLFLKMEFEKDGIDLKLLDTNKEHKLHVDMYWASVKHTTCKRRAWLQGEHCDLPMPVYREAKLDNFPLGADPSQLNLYAFDAEHSDKTNLDEVISKYGWKGSLNYEGAKKILVGADFDDKEEEIFFDVGDGFKLVVDFDAGNVDIKAMLLEGSEGSVACDLFIDGPMNKKTSSVFSPSKVRCGGKYKFVRQVELDDVPYGTFFKQMLFVKFKITNPRSVPLTSLISLR